MVRQKSFHETTISPAETVAAAKRMADVIVDWEARARGVGTEAAFHWAEVHWGIDANTLRVLRYRGEDRKSVRSDVLLNLAMACAYLAQTQPQFVMQNPHIARTVKDLMAKVLSVAQAYAPAERGDVDRNVDGAPAEPDREDA